MAQLNDLIVLGNSNLVGETNINGNLNINSDVIIVMKNGHIVETGRHEELLKQHGFYYELYNAQYANI